jgi:hypothetical protein
VWCCIFDEKFIMVNESDIIKHTEVSIIKELSSMFNDGYNYRIENAYIFKYDWESDFFCVSGSGYSYEFEVKISKSDFKHDFLKEKHKWLSGGDGWKFIPNRFYYVVPDGIIDITDIPSYAGLILIGDKATGGSRGRIIKTAPLIHKRKFDYRKTLCDKFYHRWENEFRNNRILKHRMDMLMKILDNNNIDYSYWC